MQQLPQNNQCHKCHEWFGTVHVCAIDVKAALAKCCEHCDDGDGLCVFPYYGVAPHTHDFAGNWIGSTRVLPKGEWGDNFQTVFLLLKFAQDPLGTSCKRSKFWFSLVTQL